MKKKGEKDICPPNLFGSRGKNIISEGGGGLGEYDFLGKYIQLAGGHLLHKIQNNFFKNLLFLQDMITKISCLNS